MPRPRTSQQLRDAVKRAFAALSVTLRKEGKTPAREIASVLNVSRQTAYQYLNGNVIPSRERLATAISTWDLKIEVNGYEFGAGAFESPRSGPVPQPHQLELDLTDATQGLTEFAVPGTGSKLQVTFEGLKVKLTFDLKRTA